jgi:protein SCO1/2
MLAVFIFSSCSSESTESFDDMSVTLTDHRGQTVTFPDDYLGSPMIIGYVYTNCPDICSLITANVNQIEGLVRESNPDLTEESASNQPSYILMTFDPARDTPEQMSKYAASFDMSDEPFHFLTGDSTAIQTVMERMRVRTSVSYDTVNARGERVYFLNHSDKVYLLDDNASLVYEYGGSMTSPSMMANDLSNEL